MTWPLPVVMAGWDQMVRDRVGRLRAEARDERLARQARIARAASRRPTRGTGSTLVNPPLAVTAEGNEP